MEKLFKKRSNAKKAGEKTQQNGSEPPTVSENKPKIGSLTLSQTKQKTDGMASNLNKWAKEKSKKEDSTLSRGKRLKGFVACFMVGAACTILGVYVLFLPEIDFNLSIGIYIFGNVCALACSMFVMSPLKQLKKMCDIIRGLIIVTMFMCLVLTLCAIFWWKNFGHAVLFGVLHVSSYFMYSLSFTQCVRNIMKMLTFSWKRSSSLG